MLTSITRQCTEMPSPETSWTIAVRPSPIGVATARGKLEAFALGTQGLGVQEVGPPAARSSPTSRLRFPST